MVAVFGVQSAAIPLTAVHHLMQSFGDGDISFFGEFQLPLTFAKSIIEPGDFIVGFILRLCDRNFTDSLFPE